MEFDRKDIEIGKNFFLGVSSYLTSSTTPNNLPNHAFNEIAFAGRSNVGKSSLINALTRRKNLARSSKTPGRTRKLNFFKIDDKYKELILVDLPGYGYANAPKGEISEWLKLTNYYLYQRSNLRTICLLFDSRRKLYDHDFQMINFLDKLGLSWTIILTKIDKVSEKCLINKKLCMLKTLNKKSAFYPHVFSISSVKNIGLNNLRAYISSFATKKIVL